jgi:two-component system, NarL family, invasion response regulator UvrY
MVFTLSGDIFAPRLGSAMAVSARMLLTAAVIPERIRALVVNDSPKVIDAISSALERDSRVDVVATARDAIVALRTARTQLPDLVVIDADVAYLSGLETARLLKRRLPDTKIIIISAVEDAALASAAVGFGADAFLGSQQWNEECESQLTRLFPA